MNERLRKFINYLKFSNEIGSDVDFGIKIGVSRSNLSAMLSGARVISKKTIGKIKTEFSILNDVWLLTGEGDMLVRQEAVQAVVTDDNVMSVPVVPIYAQAGFLTGQAEPVYVNSLPRMSIIDKLNDKVLELVFEKK